MVNIRTLARWLRTIRRQSGETKMVTTLMCRDWLEEQGDLRGEAVLWMVQENKSPRVTWPCPETQARHSARVLTFDWVEWTTAAAEISTKVPSVVFKFLREQFPSELRHNREFGSRLGAEIALLDAYVAASR